MQEETNSVLYQRAQNGWSKMSIYTLKFWPKHMKQITKCHALQVYVVVGNVENLVFGWRLCICMCAWVRACVRSFASRSVRDVRSCLCMIHMKQTLWDATCTCPSCFSLLFLDITTYNFRISLISSPSLYFIHFFYIFYYFSFIWLLQ